MKTVKTYIVNNGFVRHELARMFPDAIYPEMHPIYVNRRSVVKEFLKTNGTHLLMIDHDVVPTKSPINLDLDVVGFPTPVCTNGQVRWNIYKKPFAHMEYGSIKKMEKSVEEVDVVGTGCIMIARRVLEEVNDFTPVLSSGDVKYGTDFGFCQRVKERGFKIWVAWDYPCRHYKTIDLLEVI